MNFLNEIKINAYYKTLNEMPIDALNFLNLSGKKISKSQGANTVAAVIDTGVLLHPEFKDRLYEGICTNRNYAKTKWQDDNGHGTHVTGSVLGLNCGIASKAKVLPIKVLDGSGDCKYPQDIIKGIEYAYNWRGPNGERVNVINMSLGGPRKVWGSYFEELHNIIKKVSKEIPIVCAAGNTGKEEDHYPGSFPEVICVSAVDHEKKQALFTTTGRQVDVCQIGVDVISSYFENEYAAMSGTSMATPIVTGCICSIIGDYFLKFNKYPIEPDVYSFLRMNTKDLGIPGLDRIYGVGFVSLQPLDVDIKLIIGDQNMYINGIAYETDAPPIIHNNRFYVSLRWILEVLGGYVNFIDAIKTAIFKL